MTALPLPGVWPLAVAIAALNVPFGRLRAGAPRRSPRWFGVYAAAVFLLIALRRVFDVTGIEILILIGAMYLGQWLGRRAARDDAAPSPLRWRAATYAALLAGVMLIIGQPARAATGNEWQRLDADEPAPAFTLTSQDGRRVALKDFRGKAIVLTFMYAQCKDVCPVLPQIIGRADKALTDAERSRVRFVGISIDPRRDTPDALREFMRGHDLDSARWTLLTGSVAEAAKAAGDYGIVVRPDPQGDLVHNAVYILIDSRGHLRTEFHGLFTPTEEIVKAVRSLIAKR